MEECGTVGMWQYGIQLFVGRRGVGQRSVADRRLSREGLYQVGQWRFGTEELKNRCDKQ